MNEKCILYIVRPIATDHSEAEYVTQFLTWMNGSSPDWAGDIQGALGVLLGGEGKADDVASTK